MSGAGQITGGGEFTPATSIKEAEDWARKNVAEQVSYKNVKDIKLVNEVNATLDDLIVKRGKTKLETLIFETEGISVQSGSNAQAVGNQIFINAKFSGSVESLAKSQVSRKIRIDALNVKIKERLSLGFDAKTDRRLARYLNSIEEIKMENVDAYIMKGERYSARDLITHEYGHVTDSNTIKKLVEGIDPYDITAQQDAIRDYNNWKSKVFSSPKTKGNKLSYYATENREEFLAEAFNAYHTDKINLLTPEIKEFIEYTIKTSL